MGILFPNDLHDEFGTWPLGYISTGGPDFGEILTVVITLPNVDADRIALSGWSLAACLADPGLFSMANGFRAFLLKMGISPEAATDLGQLDEAILEKLEQTVTADRHLRWAVVQRGFADFA